jgi:hypothetical protein
MNRLAPLVLFRQPAPVSPVLALGLRPRPRSRGPNPVRTDLLENYQ